MMMIIVIFSSKKPNIFFLAFQVLLLLPILFLQAQAKCKTGCQVALASYYVWEGSNLTYISNIFGQEISQILLYNPNHIPNQDSVQSDTRVNVPFSCDCLNGDFLGHTFTYLTQPGDTYEKVAGTAFANLTTRDWVQRVNKFEPTQIPANVSINVTVNCSCGNRQVSKDYGLFSTYPLRPGDNLSVVADQSSVPADLLEKFNPSSNFSAGSGIVYVPAEDLGAVVKTSESAALDGSSHGLTGITVDKSVEFSYEELAKATDDFSLANKIGQGGFGDVYYAELRGESAAIKKMDMQATQEFLAELKVLTHVHHLNLFEDVLSQSDPNEELRKLVDPRLGDNFPLDSIRKMAQLARACTQENPQLRPSMRSIVVALMTLSSSNEDWDVGSFYENQALVNLMSGR
ncbi:hypothetical protein LWI29_025929 [Acer saccharum]|uniref:Protein kinase domain-containing protein n=1 Tax=Acer saccharum TaxID=4024 RepID=A0AA39RWQ9_ACESA|nr:hypothetical protein LWI29_025929 [Acer saccharum]